MKPNAGVLSIKFPWSASRFAAAGVVAVLTA